MDLFDRHPDQLIAQCHHLPCVHPQRMGTCRLLAQHHYLSTCIVQGPVSAHGVRHFRKRKQKKRGRTPVPHQGCEVKI